MRKPGRLAAALAAALLVAACGCGRAASPAEAASGSAPSSRAEQKSSVPASRAPVSQKLPAASSAAQADPAVLDDAVFVGDSVTLKLKNYVTLRRRADPSFFGRAKFLVAGNMGSGNALAPLGENSIHPPYNGKKALLEDSAAQMGAKKIFLMLGVNDIAPYGAARAAANLEKLCLRFLEKRPDARIILQSATPMLKSKQLKKLNNESISQYNGRLREICRKRGWDYLDVASVLAGKDGALKPEYCSDPESLGLHFTDEACRIWIRYILTHIKT